MGAATAASLSEHLLAEATRFVGYPNRRGRGRLGKYETTLWNELLPVGVRGIEWIAPSGTSLRLAAPLLDEYYSGRLLAEVPAIVSRAMSLVPLESGVPVPRQVNVYLEQATKSYVAGLWDGAVALARACLEETLEDRIGRRIGHQKRELNTWLSEADRLRLLTREQLARARTIQASGNSVLHDRSATEEEAREAIQAVRVLLSELYRRAA